MIAAPPPSWGDAAPNYMQSYGPRLAANGYSVIPIMPGTKKPGRYDARGGWTDLPSWQQFLDRPASTYQVGLWGAYPGCGVGILTGHVVAVDLDIVDPEIAAEVRLRVIERLGETPALRIGLAPKALMLYRTTKPFRKIVAHPIEVLGLGQQFVAYATHPATGKPYSWPIKQLVDIPMDKLPVVDEERCRAAVEYALEAVPPDMRPVRLATSDGAPVDAAPSASGLVGTVEAVAAALQAIPNDDLGWDDWNRVAMAAWAATQGSEEGFEAFATWSAKSKKNDPRQTRARWEHLRRSPPRRIGAGTIYKLAQDQGWRAKPEIALNPSRAAAAHVDTSALILRGRRVDESATAAPRAPAPEPMPVADRESFPSEWLDSPSLVGQCARWIIRSALYPQPTFALANTLAALGAVYGRRYRAGRTNTRTNLFAIGIAKTGAGKDHSRAAIKSLFGAAGLSLVLAGDRFASGSAILRTLHDFPSRLSHMDEMGLFMQAMTAKNASPHQRDIIKTLLEVYSSSSSTFHGQEYASKENVRIDIVNPNLCLFGTTTPQTLVPALSRGMADNGTLSRMLLVPPFDHYPDWQEASDHEPPPDLVTALQRSWEIRPPAAGNLANIQHVATSAVALIDVHWSDSVADMLRDIREIERARAREDRAIWVRATELVIKLAMIEAIARDPVQPIVVEGDILLAWKLVEWCLNYAEALLSDDVADNEQEAATKGVKRLIREAGRSGLAKSDITRRTQGLKPRERDDILATLIESGEVEARVEGGVRGRPRTIYVVS